ncbi:MAG TPA: ABC transporter permease subunit [Chthoniobacterales bacterium]|jgi:ABC-2 type transport system permease protein
MFKFLTLWNRELSSYFQSAIAYVVLFFFLLATGWNFQWVVTLINTSPTDVSIVQGFFNNFFFWFPFVLIFPLITMRTFSEEFKMGTIETLMTAPVTDLQVVLSKFFGALTFYVILWLPSLLYFVIFQKVTNASATASEGAMWGSYSIIFLLGMFYISIGCFASVLTNNQIIAAVISGVSVALFFFLGVVSLFSLEMNQHLRDVLSYFSAIDHMGTFSKGIIDTRPIAFYLSMTLLFLSLTYHIFQRRKWKS